MIKKLLLPLFFIWNSSFSAYAYSSVVGAFDHGPIGKEFLYQSSMGLEGLDIHYNSQTQRVSLDPIKLDFEAAGDARFIKDHYSQYGVHFDDAAFSLIANFAGGCCGNFAGDSSSAAAMTIMKQDFTVMTVEGKFADNTRYFTIHPILH